MIHHTPSPTSHLPLFANADGTTVGEDMTLHRFMEDDISSHLPSCGWVSSVVSVHLSKLRQPRVGDDVSLNDWAQRPKFPNTVSKTIITMGS
jgi:hypothetical protein